MEEVGFEASLEGLEGGGIPEGFGECIPEGWGSKSKGSVAPGTVLGLRDHKEVCVTRPEGAGGDMGFEEVKEVGGSKIV